MRKIATGERERILALRVDGYSIPEIVRISGSAKTTVQRYAKGIEVPIHLLKRLKEKQGGAKDRAKALRENISEAVSEKLGTLSKRDSLILLIGLYWGEGTKRDFSLINSDPYLIQTFIQCLYAFGIRKERLSLSLRVHSNISVVGAKKFWSYTTGLSEEKIGRMEIIEGKKKGKLPYGMCRVRVRSGIRDRLFIQTSISIIGKDFGKKVVSP